MRNTIILFLIALALGAYVYFYEIKGGEQRKKEKEAAEKLLHFNKDSIDYVEISAPKGHFVFRKTDDGWQIEQPVKTDADDGPITGVLSNLSSAKKKRTFSVKKEKLDSYGLGSTALTVRLKQDDKFDQTVKMGDKTSVGSNVYTTIDDSTVALIPSYIKNSANKSLFDWRYKKALHFPKGKIREITLKSPRGTFHFVKDGDQWLMTEPLNTKADKSKVDAILNKLDWGVVKEVVAEEAKNLNRYRLNKPAYRVEMLSGEKARYGVSFSSVKKNVSYGKDDARPIIFKVDSIYLKPLNKRLFDYRTKDVTTFNRDQVDSLRLFFEDSLMVLHKDTSGVNWVFSDGKPAKSWKITNILSALNNTKARRYVEEKPVHLTRYGLKPPKGVISVFSKGEKIAELKTGKEVNDKRVYALNTLSGKVVVIDKSRIKQYFPKKKDLIKPEKKKEEKKEEKS